MSLSTYKPASLLRRLGALIYDIIILIALSFVISMFAIMINNGQAVPPNNFWLQSALVMSWLSFYCYFFTRGGQTIGMRAWKIKLQRVDGQAISLQLALIRCFLGATSLFFLGIGYIWILFDAQRKALHDRASDTQVLLIK